MRHPLALTLIACAAFAPSCRHDADDAGLALPVPDSPFPAPRISPLPPPPSPPPLPSDSFPPPPPIANFLARKSATTIDVTLHLVDENSAALSPRASFMGRRSTRQVKLRANVAATLVGRLGRETSYRDGGAECGSMGEHLGIRLRRGDETLELIEDCGNVFFSPQHYGDTCFSDAMAAYLDELRRDLKF